MNTTFSHAIIGCDGQIVSSRSELRRTCLAQRLALTTESRQRFSLVIESHLERHLSALRPACIAVYQPIQGEFDPIPLALRLFHAGWNLSLPVVIEKQSPLEFRFWQPQTALDRDLLNIPVPPPSAPSVHPDVVLTPFLAFDLAGYRLGYGGGYYDRTLVRLGKASLRIGVGFDLGRCARIPHASHDVQLDVIITETGPLIITI